MSVSGHWTPLCLPDCIARVLPGSCGKVGSWPTMHTVVLWPAILSSSGNCQREDHKKFNRFPLAANLSSQGTVWKVDNRLGNQHFPLIADLLRQGDCLESWQYMEKSSIFFLVSLGGCQRADHHSKHSTHKCTRFPANTADILAGDSLKAPSSKDIHTHF